MNQQSYSVMPGLSRQEYIVQAYCVLYCYVQSIYIVQIGFFLSTQCSLVDNVLRLSSWLQDGEASSGADPGASDVELSVREAGLQQVQKGFQLDLALGAKEHLVLPLVALKHLQLVVHWLAKKEQKKLE